METEEKKNGHKEVEYDKNDKNDGGVGGTGRG